MRMNNEPPPPSDRSRRIRDFVVQRLGIYRIWLLTRRCSISLTARVVSPSRLQLSRDVSIQGGSIVHCGGKAWCDYRGYVRLAQGVRIGPNCVIYGAGGVDLGEYVHLGPGVKIMSQAGRHDVKRISRNPTYMLESIYIGAGTWVGSGAIILGGARIGRCVSVVPNSVVMGDVPDYAVVGGNPARVFFKNKELD